MAPPFENPIAPSAHTPGAIAEVRFPKEDLHDPFCDSRFWYHDYKFESGDDRKIPCGRTYTIDLGGRWDQCKVLVENSGSCNLKVTFWETLPTTGPVEGDRKKEKGMFTVPKKQNSSYKNDGKVDGVTSVEFACSGSDGDGDCIFSYQIRAF